MGGVVGLIFLIVIIVVVCKKCRQQAMPVTQAPANGTSVIITGGGANYGPPPVYGQYPPGYSQPFQGQPAYGQPYGEPYTQPAYGQLQPYSSPQDNPQYPPVYLSNMNPSPIK